MATVRTPLLSFGASGKLAKTLVFTRYKGIDVSREYVTPANPRSPGQTTNRTAFQNAVSAYRNFITDPTEREALARAATNSGRPQSGFNVWLRNALPIIETNPDASFTENAVLAGPGHVQFFLIRADTGAMGNEAGLFEKWMGTRPDNLLLVGTQALIAGNILFANALLVGETKYFKIRKDNSDRSGIEKITRP